MKKSLKSSLAEIRMRYHAATDFGFTYFIQGFIRRRAGRLILILINPRLHLGRKCDIRRGGRFLVSRGSIVQFGDSCVIDISIDIECRGKITIGAGTIIGHHCTIAADEAINIGEKCLIAEFVSIRDHDHAFGDKTQLTIDQGRKSLPVQIGDNVWIGSKVTVTKGVTIGSNAVIAANAVVTKDIEPYSIAAGVPARVIRTR